MGVAVDNTSPKFRRELKPDVKMLRKAGKALV